MHELKYLENFLSVLKNENYEVRLLKNDKFFNAPYLAVTLGKESEVDSKVLEIYVREQEAGQSLTPDRPHKDTILQCIFELEYPFSVKRQYTNDVSALLHFLNQQHRMSGYVLDEINNKVIYRYNAIVTNTGINAQVLLGIIGIILLFYDIHRTTIEEVAEGKVSFNTIISRLLETYEKISKF